MKHNNGLKSCPFCGGEAWLYSYYDCELQAYVVVVECGVCGARGKEYCAIGEREGINLNAHPYKDAVEAWNRRAKNKAMAVRNMMRVLDPLA